MTTTTHTEADYECKYCDATTDELTTDECDESEIGFHVWNHTDRSKVSGTDASIQNTAEDEEADEAPEDWKTMDADEVKREMGFEQVNGLVWEQSGSEENDDNTESNSDHWQPNGLECPACGAEGDKQMTISTPSSNTSKNLSLPDRVVECGECGVTWEK